MGWVCIKTIPCYAYNAIHAIGAIFSTDGLNRPYSEFSGYCDFNE